jgi:CRISPR-associated protein Cmr1
MPRIIPDFPVGWKPPQLDSGRSYKIELMTPLFGGGVETRVNDSSLPIRPTSIRGQLQFWWRATVGAQYATREELRAAQSAVWGDTSQASRVQVRVELLEKPSEPKVCAVIKPNHKGKDQVFWESPFQNTALPYALFPFQGKPANKEGPKVDPASCIHSAKFRLTVICHKDIDFAKQVEPALWAWVNFGGLGSRTRRGCGAIKCSMLMAKDRNDKCSMLMAKDRNELIHQLKSYSSPSAPKDWPTLAEAILVGDETNNPLDAWSKVIGLLRDFRQAVNIGRNPGTQPNRPGRSRWPEPETIRRVTGRRHSQHARMQNVPDDAFPRAELGLPIVFHFKDEGEPPDTVLYPAAGPEGKRDRMATPLILKPLALANGKFVPVIVRLKTARLTGVDLRIKKKDLSSLPQELANQVRSTMQPNDNEGSLPLPDPTRLVDPSLSNYPNSPLTGSPNGSAIEAFLAFAREQGFTEVTR